MQDTHKKVLKNAGLPCGERFKLTLLLKIIGGNDFVEIDGSRDFFLIDSNPKKQELLKKTSEIKSIIDSILFQFNITNYEQKYDHATMTVCLKPDADIDGTVEEYLKMTFDDDSWPDTWGEGDISLGEEYGADGFPTDVYELTPVLEKIILQS